MSGPDVVRIKRKRSEQAPEALLVERPGKRQHVTDLHYVLQKKEQDTARDLFDTDDAQQISEQRDSPSARGKASHASGNGLHKANRERRTFHLKRPSTPEAGVKKRKGKGGDIATFVEKGKHKMIQGFVDQSESVRSESDASTSAEKPLKRPGRGAAVKASSVNADPRSASRVGGRVRTNSRLEAMAKSLHHSAMTEAARDTLAKPKVTAQPKLPPHRSRELHGERVLQSKSEDGVRRADATMELDDEADYVYDTYVLAPSSTIGVAQIDAPDNLGNVGYLVIREEDQSVWETYIEDEPSDKDWNSDEDDENAEDWYGADYPDEELASDDEYGRNPYSFRANGASDDEEWDETGRHSDEEFERQMNPWRKKTPQQFSKYFTGIGGEDQGDG